MHNHSMPEKKLIKRYWLIMVTELAIMFLVTVMSRHHALVALYSLVMAMFAFFTIEICFELRFFRSISVILGVCASVSGVLWLMPWLPPRFLPISLFLTLLFFAAFYALAIIAIGKHVFLSARATMNMIVGSISIYLLIGLCFAFVYALISLFMGGVFFVDGASMQVGLKLGEVGLKEFLYFSFSTLATIGYGDITPKDSLTRMTSYLEGIIGSLYLAVVVAKLVGMYVTQGIRVHKNSGE